MSGAETFLRRVVGALDVAGVPVIVLGVDVFVATAEDTVLAKLEWSKLGESEKQLRDVRAILETKGVSLDIAYIDRWLDELGVRELWERVQREHRGR